MDNTTKHIKQLVESAVKKAIKESAELGQFVLTGEFEEGLHRLEEMVYKLRGFIQEYDSIMLAINQEAQKYELQLVDSTAPRYFDIEDAINGSYYNFELVYNFPNVNPDSLSDEAYKRYTRQLETIGSQIQSSVQAEYGQIRVISNDAGITIQYSIAF